MMTPLLPMHTPRPHLRAAADPRRRPALPRHGAAGQPCAREGLIEARRLPQLECYEAAVLWARTEGFIPAPETSHAIAAAIARRNKAKEEGKEKTILFNWSGHGLMDGYDAYLGGRLENYHLTDEEMAKSLRSIEGLPMPPPLG
jgi:tryptophan synthase beta chain